MKMTRPVAERTGRVSQMAPGFVFPSVQAWADALSDPATSRALNEGIAALAAGRRGMTPTQPDRRITERRVADRRALEDPATQARIARRLAEYVTPRRIA